MKPSWLIPAAKLEEMMEQDSLLKAVVEDREGDVREGRTSKWTKSRPGFEIEPKEKDP